MASLTRSSISSSPNPKFHGPKATSLARSLQKAGIGILEDQSYPLAYLHHRNAGGGYIRILYLDGSLIRLQESVEVLQRVDLPSRYGLLFPEILRLPLRKRLYPSRATDSPGMPFSYMCFKFLTCIGHKYSTISSCS